jgi:septum formation protein
MLKSLLKNKKIILASQSPRRKELLKGLDIDFEVKILNIPENYPETLEKIKVAEYLAELKVSPFVNQINENEIIITADTIVIVDNTILGKPKNEDDAKNMLRQLSGKTHQVITGVCILSNEKKYSFSDQTLVTFNAINESELLYYIENYKPYDKAGSYGVQEWIGYIGIEKINGCYFNVMGLPVRKIYAALLNFAS